MIDHGSLIEMSVKGHHPNPNCLFCSANLPPPGKVWGAITIGITDDGEPVTLKVDEDDGDGIADTVEEDDPATESGYILSGTEDATPAGDDSPIRDDLRAIFIVRKLLDLPGRKCEEFLQWEEEGYPRPGSWFQVCGKCNAMVRECYEAYQRIGHIQRWLRRMKGELKDLIRETCPTDVRKRNVNGETWVADDIRSCVVTGTPKMPSTGGIRMESISGDDLIPQSRNGFKNGTYICKHCPSGTATFDFRQRRYEHMRKFHNDKFAFHCGKCGIGYEQSESLYLHERACRKGGPSGKGSSSTAQNTPTPSPSTCKMSQGGRLGKSVPGDDLTSSSIHRNTRLDLNVKRKLGDESRTSTGNQKRSRRTAATVYPVGGNITESEDDNDDISHSSEAASPVLTGAWEHDQDDLDWDPFAGDNVNEGLQQPKGKAQSRRRGRSRNNNCEGVSEKSIKTDLDFVTGIETTEESSIISMDFCEDETEKPLGSVECTTTKIDTEHAECNEAASPVSTGEWEDDDGDPDWDPSDDDKEEVELQPEGNSQSRRRGRPRKNQCKGVLEETDFDDGTEKITGSVECTTTDTDTDAENELSTVSKSLIEKTIPPRSKYIHKCKECPAVYRDPVKLSQHRKGHIGNDGAKCSECGWFFENERGMKVHLFRHHPEKSKAKVKKKRKKKVNKRTNSVLHKCNECPAFFRAEAHYMRHRDLHLNNSGTACPKCSWLVRNGVPNMTYHMWLRHPKPGTKIGVSVTKGVPYYCDHCPMILTSENNLQRHHRSFHKDVKPYSCENCDEQFIISKQLLEMHMERNHPDLIKKESKSDSPLEAVTEELQCEHCSETFRSKLKLDYHIAKMHPSSLLKCRICDYHPKTYAHLHVHMRANHKQIRKRNGCRRSALSKSKDEPKFICELCSKELISKFSLENHRMVFHYKELGLDPEKCPDCGRNFPTAASLAIHIRRVHDKIKDRFCEYCGKAFVSQGTLNKHILIHTAPKEQHTNYKFGPFICEYCPAGTAPFPTRQGHYFHMKKFHNDKYSYHCGKCGTGYVLESTAILHEKECKGNCKSPKEKIMLICEYCSRGFKNPNSLSKHLLTHTAPNEVPSKANYKDGPFNCEHCPSGTATFNVRPGLHYHMQKFHLEKYPFHCGKCGVGFEKDYKLSLHEKTCQGKKGRNPPSPETETTDSTETPAPSTSSSLLTIL